MTLERAAELIEKLPCAVDRADLFEHFVKYFKIDSKNRIAIVQFAELSGFLIAQEVEQE